MTMSAFPSFGGAPSFLGDLAPLEPLEAPRTLGPEGARSASGANSDGQRGLDPAVHMVTGQATTCKGSEQTPMDIEGSTMVASRPAPVFRGASREWGDEAWNATPSPPPPPPPSKETVSEEDWKSYYPSPRIHEEVKAFLRLEQRLLQGLEKATEAGRSRTTIKDLESDLAQLDCDLGKIELQEIRGGVPVWAWCSYVTVERKWARNDTVSAGLGHGFTKGDMGRNSKGGMVFAVTRNKGFDVAARNEAEEQERFKGFSSDESESSEEGVREEVVVGSEFENEEEVDQTLKREREKHLVTKEKYDQLRALFEAKELQESLKTDGRKSVKAESVLAKYFPKQAQKLWQVPLKVTKASVYGPLVGEASLPKYAGDYEDDVTVVEWARKLSNLFFRVAGVPIGEAVAIMSQCFPDQSPAFVLFQALLEKTPDISYEEVLEGLCEEFMGCHTREVHAVELQNLVQGELPVAKMVHLHAKLWARVNPSLSASHQIRDLPHRLGDKMREEFWKWEARMNRKNEALTISGMLSQLMQKERDLALKEESARVFLANPGVQNRWEENGPRNYQDQPKRGDRPQAGGPMKRPAHDLPRRAPIEKDFRPPNCRRCGTKKHPEGKACYAATAACLKCKVVGHYKGSPMCAQESDN